MAIAMVGAVFALIQYFSHSTVELSGASSTNMSNHTVMGKEEDFSNGI